MVAAALLLEAGRSRAEPGPEPIAAAAPTAAGAEVRHEQFATHDGVKLHYVDAGSGAVTFVFVPGWMMPARVFDRQVRALAPRHRVLVLDPRSQGRSGLAESHAAGTRAKDIGALLAAARVERYVLVGWSLGVMEVLDFIARTPHEGLEAVALVDNSVGLGAPPAAGSGRFARALKDPHRRRAALEGFVDSLFKRPVDRDLRTAILESALRMPAKAALEAVSLPYPRTYYRETLLRLETPALYAVTPRLRDQAEELARLRPAARVELFEGAGHALFVDEPERFDALLEALAREVLERRAAGVSGGGPR